MKRILLFFLAIGVVPLASLADVDVLRLSSPAAPASSGPQLTMAANGELWLSWVEELEENNHRLLVARFDALRSAWDEPREAVRGTGWTVSWADTPQLAVGPGGQLTALWYVANPSQAHAHHGSYRAWIRQSSDGGRTWGEPAPLSAESHRNEFASLVALEDGRVLSVWLDGRGKHEANGATALYGRVLGDGSAETLLDPRVCDCCSTALVTLPDGSAYSVYRDRGEDEVRDLAGMRWRDGHWSPAQGLPRDQWRIAGCPVNGPALTRSGSRLGLVWFTGSHEQPRVNAAWSTDFAVQWQAPQVLDNRSAPVGRAAGVLLPGGKLWSTWIADDGAIALRALSSQGELSPITSLTSPIDAPAVTASHSVVDPRHRATGVPRIAWAARAPGMAPRAVVAYTGTAESGETRVQTLLLTLPAAAAATDVNTSDCGCGVPGEEGHPVRGRVVRLLPERQSVLVAHEEIPGVMRAMTMAFRVDPRLLEQLEPEQAVVGRVARRADGQWWLFGMSLPGR